MDRTPHPVSPHAPCSLLSPPSWAMKEVLCLVSWWASFFVGLSIISEAQNFCSLELGQWEQRIVGRVSSVPDPDGPCPSFPLSSIGPGASAWLLARELCFFCTSEHLFHLSTHISLLEFLLVLLFHGWDSDVLSGQLYARSRVLVFPGQKPSALIPPFPLKKVLCTPVPGRLWLDLQMFIISPKCRNKRPLCCWWI